MPAPAIPSEKSDSESDSKSNPHSAQKDSGHGIPTRICHDRVTVHEPGIVSGNVNHLRISRFNDDCASLSCYLLLFVAIELAGLSSLLAHRLNGVRHILLLIGVRISKRRSPREVLVHIL